MRLSGFWLGVVMATFLFPSVHVLSGCRTAPEKLSESKVESANAESEASDATAEGERRGASAAAEASDPSAEGEGAALVEECPSPGPREEEQCDDVSPLYGLSPKHPLEWGPDGPKHMDRLFCSDGSDIALLYRGPSPAKDPSQVLSWSAVCDGKRQRIYARRDRCGSPCPPKGFRLSSMEFTKILGRLWANRGSRELGPVLEVIDELIALDPDWEHVYLLGAGRLMYSRWNEHALAIVEKGLSRLPGSEPLTRRKITLEAELRSPEEERALQVRYSRDPADTGVDSCDDLPEGFGVTSAYPLELPHLQRVVCADGTPVIHDRSGNVGGFKGETTSPASTWAFGGRAPADIIDSHVIQCPTMSTTLYLNKYREGRECSPEGLRLIGADVHDAWIKSRRGDLAEAIEAIQTARALDPTLEWMHLELIRLYVRGNDIPAALEAASEGLEQIPHSGWLRYHRGMFLLRFDRAEEAERELDTLLSALETTGDQSIRPPALCGKAVASKMLGRSDEVVATYRTQACEWGHEPCCSEE